MLIIPRQDNPHVYDDAFQLIRENNKYANETYVYEYDRYGNITSKKTYAYTTGTLGAVTNTVNYTYGDESWGDLLTNYNGTTITYDVMGNPQKWHNAADIEWLENAGKQMSLFNAQAGGLYMYDYNVEGIRTNKTIYAEDYITVIYESEYILNGTTIIQEKRTYGDGSVVILDFLYDDSGVILGVIYNGTVYYYRKNLQGDITGIVNSAGTLVVSYTYDAWGNPVSITGSMASTLGEINPIRYRGYYYDTETGFYYLNSRYYDPQVGRFINADVYISTGQDVIGCNMFSYCLNNPIGSTDMYGQISFSFEYVRHSYHYTDDFTFRGKIPKISLLYGIYRAALAASSLASLIYLEGGHSNFIIFWGMEVLYIMIIPRQ